MKKLIFSISLFLMILTSCAQTGDSDSESFNDGKPTVQELLKKIPSSIEEFENDYSSKSQRTLTELTADDFKGFTTDYHNGNDQNLDVLALCP